MKEFKEFLDWLKTHPEASYENLDPYNLWKNIVDKVEEIIKENRK